MASLKPHLIRADTLDLQSSDSPSAKDHTRHPIHPFPTAPHSAAPHQNQTLRSVEQDALQEQMNRPSLSHDRTRGKFPDEPDFYDDPDDDGPGTSQFADADSIMQSADDSGVDDSDAGENADDDGLDDDMMDRISSSPSIDDDEDIDFEFVYALHTFVATVEGQANATKGDTMVLLDDSNSYWWLVRVVKDGSIGYLPAEHIETPSERLARLNKRRNIDLSATMLSDNAEKSKKSLKKAMRRRNAKTVQFAAPQYFEPSDVEYSDEEEMMDGDFDKAEQATGPGDDDGPDPEEPSAERSGQAVNGLQVQQSNEASSGGILRPADGDRAADEVSLEDQAEEVGARSKRSLVRNTDSFLRDDGIETKKISLTPRLLQGDSELAPTREDSEPRHKSSVESFDKMLTPDNDRSGDEKKKKEKKGGMLGGFFKRKDKKGKASEQEAEEGKKASGEASRVTPQSKKSSESLSQEAKPAKGDKISQRQGSKLQKQPPPHLSPKTSPSKDYFPKMEADSGVSSPSQGPSLVSSSLPSPAAEPSKVSQEAARSRSTGSSPERAVSPSGQRSIFTTMTDALKPGPTQPPESDGQPKAAAAAAAAAAVSEARDHISEVSDEDSSQESGPGPARPTVDVTPSTLGATRARKASERLSESPIEVSPIEPCWESQQSSIESQTPNLMVDTSSNSERRSISPMSPTTSSSSSSIADEEADAADAAEEARNPMGTSPQVDGATPSTARSTPTWSDASLRTYMENGEDIRDLLLIVHDKSNVVPAGPEHPITGHLFSAEKGRLADMQANLDSMLTTWLARKSQIALSR